MTGRSSRPRGSSVKPLYSPAAVRELLSRSGLRPNKGLGQNFLVDGNILRKIVALAGIAPGDRVLEIGPGLGALTQTLLEAGASVIAIEKDGALVALLREVLGPSERFELLHADALEVDFAAALAGRGGAGDALPGPYKIVANLPYYISTPLIMKVVACGSLLARAVLMVQEEVADRLLASPGGKSYGSLTVAVQYGADVEFGAKVPPTVFYPVPSVGSAVVVLTPRPPRVDVGDEALFFSLVRSAFGQRRKTLRNALRALAIPADRLEKAFQESRIDPGRRGETLSVEEFARLCRSLSDA